MKFQRRQFLRLGAGAAAIPAVSRVGWTQAYPSRPVRLIVPAAAGGGIDIGWQLYEMKARRNGVEPGDRIIHSERDLGMSPGAVQVWFHRLYNEKLGLDGASSHSGRRTFVTRCAKNIVAAGGSLRDGQELAGHASLATTQRYIQGDTAAKRRVVDL
jgi:Phage integrase family